jgi:hypothetical protein
MRLTSSIKVDRNGRKIHRRDAEFAEGAQREEMMNDECGMMN